MHDPLKLYIERLLPDVSRIDKVREQSLDMLAEYVRSQLGADEPAQLTFICTHNSRRSQMGQIWAATAAAYYGVEGVATFSGGTEATAFDPRAVAAIERAGFAVSKGAGDNPRYRVTYAAAGPELECFSKKYDDAFNPQDHFAAVMTCSQADQSCPLVHGALARIAIPYEDPKLADGTAGESATYDERSRQIGTEMFYVFSRHLLFRAHAGRTARAARR